MSFAERVQAGPPVYIPALNSGEYVERHPAGDKLEHRRALQTGHNSLHAVVAFKRGDVIQDFGASEVLPQPNYLTMQTGPHSHIVLEPAYLLNINHSCAPNTFWDTTKMQFEAIEDVAPGSELTFFYPSTEWAMETPFDCRCGAAACLGRIAGAKHLSDEQFARYRFNKHILDARAGS